MLDRDARFEFGMYKNCKMLDVTRQDKGSYYFWAKTHRNPAPCLRQYIVWVEAHFRVDEFNQTLRDTVDDTVVALPKATPKAKAKSKISKFEMRRLEWAKNPRCEPQ